MTKKFILIITILSITIPGFSQSTNDVDNFWINYASLTTQMANHLKLVRSSADFERFKSSLQQLVLQNTTAMQNLNLKQEHGILIYQRYSYHLKNNTSLGQSLKNANRLFYGEYKRIEQIPGGKEFLDSIFKKKPAGQ